MDPQTQTRANLLQLALQRLSSGMPNAAILSPPQVSMGGRAPLADLQPPQTSAPANVYGYPEGLPPEIRGVYNATQPFSRGMQGQMNMVDNMNAAYDVRDQLGNALRSGMGGSPSYGDMGADQSGVGGGVTSPSSPSTATRSRASESSTSSSKPKAKPSGASESGTKAAGSEADSSKGGADNALSMLRKQRSGGMWDTLGTGVSLVQRSLQPEKGGLKSRSEYDRLLRGSDNYKKLSGDDQQRVRQAFSQWMNEQTIFKGKA